MKSFLVRFFISGFLIAIPPLMLHYLTHGKWLAPKFGAMFFFFALITFLTCITVIVAQARNSKTAVQFFMGATVIKLMGCMLFALVYLLKNAVNGLIFTGSFFYLYFCFTVFEVYTLLSNLRVQNKK